VAAEQWNAAPPRYSRPEEALRGDCPLSSMGKERKRKIERGRGRKGGGERESSRRPGAPHLQTDRSSTRARKVGEFVFH